MKEQSCITYAIEYLGDIFQQRLDIYFNRNDALHFRYRPFQPVNDGSELYKLLARQDLKLKEKLLLLIAFMPHVQPVFFDHIIQQYLPTGGDFAEIGGVKGANQRSMLPTGETAQFILAGTDVIKRLNIQHYLLGESLLVKEGWLQVEKVKDGEPLMSGKLVLNEEFLLPLLTNKAFELQFGSEFPAKKITTKMNWDDAVLNEATLNQINDIMIWMQYNQKLLEDEVMQRKIKPGYRVLFYGPSGTGKTLTATLLGNHLEKEVYRIDLSQVVSKYIGETEKNLEKVFSKAEHKNWILFFDEADALFGKRTNVQNSHDRYANQEVSYLLQRIEDYPGLLILASNFKNNIDSAFMRRFHTTVYFPIPDSRERMLLWQKSMPASMQPEPGLSIADIAAKYEITGAAILNVMHYATLRSMSANDNYLRQRDVLEGIRRELRKAEKTMAI